MHNELLQEALTKSGTETVAENVTEKAAFSTQVIKL